MTLPARPLTRRQRFRAALAGEPVDRPPIWMMRQAGRTLPEYRALRREHDFVTVMTTPELACEVTLQPLRRMGWDAAVLFSDILTVPMAMGQTLRFAKRGSGEVPGPHLAPVVRSRADVEALAPARVADSLSFVGETLDLLRKELPDAGLLGFAGAPFTLACYMVEGHGSKSWALLKGLMVREPATFDALLSRLAEAVADLLILQLEHGADVVQLFDTWAGELAEPMYRSRVAPFNQRIIERVQAAGGRVLLYLKNGAHLLDAALDAGANGVGLDWRVDMARAVDNIETRAAAGAPRQIVQGNLDPSALFGTRAHIFEQVRAVHSAVGGRTGHIFNLGHGVLPDTPLSGIQSFVDAVHALAEPV